MMYFAGLEVGSLHLQRHLQVGTPSQGRRYEGRRFGAG